MKAWEVTTDYADCSDVVFANSRNDARKKLVNGETVLDSTLANDDSVEYIEVRATRLPKLDGMEKEAEANWILAESRIRGTEMAHLKYYELKSWDHVEKVNTQLVIVD